MKIETMFSAGDMAWCVTERGVEHLTIGQVRVEVTESPGTGDTIFDNYKPQSGYKEQYMCVETGIGSGNVYTLGETIFGTEKEAMSAHSARLEKYGG